VAGSSLPRPSLVGRGARGTVRRAQGEEEAQCGEQGGARREEHGVHERRGAA
jgi:hypothetical protein